MNHNNQEVPFFPSQVPPKWIPNQPMPPNLRHNQQNHPTRFPEQHHLPNTFQNQQFQNISPNQLPPPNLFANQPPQSNMFPSQQPHQHAYPSQEPPPNMFLNRPLQPNAFQSQLPPSNGFSNRTPPHIFPNQLPPLNGFPNQPQPPNVFPNRPPPNTFRNGPPQPNIFPNRPVPPNALPNRPPPPNVFSNILPPPYQQGVSELNRGLPPHVIQNQQSIDPTSIQASHKPSNFDNSSSAQSLSNNTGSGSMFSVPPPPFMGRPTLPLRPPYFEQVSSHTNSPIFPLSNWNPLTMQQINSSNITKQSVDDGKEKIKILVQDWLRSKKLNERVADTSKKMELKIFDYKKELASYVAELSKLRDLNDQLAANMDSPDEKWQSLLNSIHEIKIKIEKQKSFLFDPMQLQHVQRKIKNRQKKRENQRLKRKQRQQKYIENLAKRIDENERIDQWQAEENGKLKEKKLVDTLKNEAGESLQEVKFKSSQTTEFIEKLQLLQQLRDLRKDRAIFRGILVLPRHNEQFSTSVSKVSAMLDEQIKTYKVEEKALRVLREEETEELQRKQVEEQKQRKEKRKSALHKVDPLYAYRSYWLQGEENVSGLIHIRTMWDMFICAPNDPAGSQIPQDWVKPSPPSSEKWKQFLDDHESAKSS